MISQLIIAIVNNPGQDLLTPEAIVDRAFRIEQIYALMIEQGQ